VVLTRPLRGEEPIEIILVQAPVRFKLVLDAVDPIGQLLDVPMIVSIDEEKTKVRIAYPLLGPRF
jgi:hypothetical protein